MLVLAAKAGETVDIGDEIRVRVIATESGRVRLGIETPSEIESRVQLSELTDDTDNETVQTSE